MIDIGDLLTISGKGALAVIVLWYLFVLTFQAALYLRFWIERDSDRREVSDMRELPKYVHQSTDWDFVHSTVPKVAVIGVIGTKLLTIFVVGLWVIAT